MPRRRRNSRCKARSAAGSSGAESRNLRISSAFRGREGQNTGVDLARIAWLAAVLICLITVLILAVQGYYGYAGVTFAVAVAAAINLF